MSHSVTSTESPLLLFAFYIWFYFIHWPTRTHQNQVWDELHNEPVLEGKALHGEWLGAVWSRGELLSKGPRALPAEQEKTAFHCQEQGWPGSAQSCPALQAQVSPGTHMAAPVISQQAHPLPFALHFYSQENKPASVFSIRSKTVLSYKQVCDQIMLWWCAAPSHWGNSIK